MSDIFEDIKKDLDAEIARLKDTGEIIRFLQIRIAELREQFISASQIARDYRPNEQAMQAVSGMANTILLQEGMDAIKETKEFDLEMFRWRFRTALLDPKSLTLRAAGESLSVSVNLNETAGSLSDYANAVTQTREQLGIGVLDPMWASHMWAEKYYRPAREGSDVPPRTANRKDRTAKYINDYWSTIRTRISNFSSLAPFWEIVDKGSLGITLPGERGGIPYPATGPTNFVQATINKLQKEFQSALLNAKKFLTELQSSVDKLQKAIIYAEDLLNNIDIVTVEVKKRLGDLYTKVDQQKLGLLIERLNRGEDIPGRISLGSVEGQRVQRRTIELQRAIKAFRNR